MSDWKKPRRFERNLVVIGGGAAGLVTAYIAAAVKAKVTLIEKHRMGGDCLNTGCVPSKALIRSAKFLSQLARAKEFGIREARAEFDFAEVMERVQRVVQAVEPHDSVERYTGLGVEVIEGAAKLVSPWEVEVVRHDGGTQRLTTRSIVIAAGGRPFVPPVPGLDAVGYLTSDTVWELRELPRRLLVLGGGPIGSELAQAFARFGARVTQVQQGPRILPREDAEVSELVAARFRAEGIDVRTGHKAKQFVVENGEKILIAEHAGGDVRIPFDAVLLAVGRVANLQGYGLEELGVKASRTIETNAFLQTNYPNIYAAGDVAGPFQFTHTAAHQAWYAAVNALFDPFKKFRVDYSVIPWATFVDPEVARVGLNEQEAKEQGIALRGEPLRPRRSRPRDRRRRDARLRQGADRAGPRQDPRRDHRRRARRRPDRRVRAGDEARHRAQQDPRHPAHLPDAGGSQQIRGRRLEEGARAANTAALGRALPCLAAAIDLSAKRIPNALKER